MTEVYPSSESETPRNKSLIEYVTELAEDAVLSGEEFPESRIREGLRERGLDEPSVNLAVMLGMLAYEDALDVLSGKPLSSP